jgi:hypothetical protein
MPDGVSNEQTLSDSVSVPPPGTAKPKTLSRTATLDRPVEIRTRARANDPFARPPINLRFTIPFFGKRFYFAMVAGKERRGSERIALERRRHPLGTRANLAFIFIMAMVLYMLTLGMFLVYAAVVEV